MPGLWPLRPKHSNLYEIKPYVFLKDLEKGGQCIASAEWDGGHICL